MIHLFNMLVPVKNLLDKKNAQKYKEVHACKEQLV